MPPTLFVWDFDNTVVLDNTDTLIFRVLAPDLLATLHPPTPALWTDLINQALTTLSHRGISAAQICSAAAKAPLPPDTRRALLAIASHPHTASAILSDANSLFISACLQKHNLHHPFIFQAGIVTNPAHIDPTGRLIVTPYLAQENPHSCNTCPRNLCKGEVVDRWREGEYRAWRVVYVGDGGNDFCPVKRLRHGDVALVRKGMGLHARLSDAPHVTPAVRIWAHPHQLRAMVEEEVRAAAAPAAV